MREEGFYTGTPPARELISEAMWLVMNPFPMNIKRSLTAKQIELLFQN